MSTLQVSQQSNASYATVTQQPTKEQAILLDSIEGITIQDYAVSIGNIIGPSNIKFISRISNGRICLYLSSKQVADNLVNKQTKINSRNHTLEIRPLISNLKRTYSQLPQANLYQT